MFHQTARDMNTGGESDEGSDSDHANIALGSDIYSSTANTLSIRFLMFSHERRIQNGEI